MSDRLYKLIEAASIFTAPLPDDLAAREAARQGWTKNSDGSYNAPGDVSIRKEFIRNGKLIMRFGKVDGSMRISDMYELDSLEGCPQSVGGPFACMQNSLVSLEGGPSDVGGYYTCEGNAITSLKGVPEILPNGFFCNRNRLISLKDGPQKVGVSGNGISYDCSVNLLTTLEGAPEYIPGHFMCEFNQLTSLKGSPKEVGGDFVCSRNKVRFTKDMVRAVCKVGGRIDV